MQAFLGSPVIPFAHTFQGLKGTKSGIKAIVGVFAYANYKSIFSWVLPNSLKEIYHVMTDDTKILSDNFRTSYVQRGDC